MKEWLKARVRRWLGLDKEGETRRGEVCALGEAIERARAEIIVSSKERIASALSTYPDRDEMERRLGVVGDEARAALQALSDTLAHLTDRDRSREWFGLDGKGGLVEILDSKDREFRAVSQSLDNLYDKVGKEIIPLLNHNTMVARRLIVYEQQVPTIARVFKAMQERAVREQRRQEAARALAAAPVAVLADDAPPADAVADDVSEQVAGG